MIDQSSLLQWKQIVPWPNELQVEQDLVISRALIDIFNHPILKTSLAFRGGTALQKLFFPRPLRYSEDLDFVQINTGSIGPLFDAIKEVLDPWLGKPKRKIGAGVATLIYRFNAADPNKTPLRLKVEINTREHFNCQPLLTIPFSVTTPWFNGKTTLITYRIEELLATKLRALYQRNKGRDLFDLARAIELLVIDVAVIIKGFQYYLSQIGLIVSRAEFEQNLLLKKELMSFRQDIEPLLPNTVLHNFNNDFIMVMEQIINLLPGLPWQGKKTKLKVN
jgi:predicted nucleotidyltransferase component of viral defense system